MVGVREILRRRATISALGLDVGHAHLRVAQLRRSGAGWRTAALLEWQLPAGSAGLLEDEAAARRAARWLGRAEFVRRQVVVGLSAPDIELHAMELPRLAANQAVDVQVANARAEMGRLMGFSAESAEVDYWMLPDGRAMTATAIGVAAEQRHLSAVLRFCAEARLDCVRIDAAVCAAARFGALYRGLGGGTRDVWGVLDLGEKSCRLTICVGEVPVLARAFDYGGRVWTERLAAALGVSPETAQRHKCDHGIAPLARPAGEGRGHVVGQVSPLSEMIYNVLRADLEAMLGEIERSYRYALQCFPQQSAGPLLLVGGGAGLRNLETLLAQKLGIAVLAPGEATLPAGTHLDLGSATERQRGQLGSYAGAIGLAAAD